MHPYGCKHLLPLSTALIACVLTSALPENARAVPGNRSCTAQVAEQAPRPGDLLPTSPPSGVRADTVRFGYYTIVGGEPYAVLGEEWTFDHGADDPLEGWTSVNLTNAGLPFRRIDAAAWSGHGNAVTAPVIAGTASAWIGAFEAEADSLCWAGGLGYGNNWCQRFVSPPVTYDGSGDVALSFRYFHDAETNFEYTRVYALRDDAGELPLVDPGLTGKIGNPATGTYPTAGLTIDGFGLVGSGTFQLVFEFESDGGWSDEDGMYATDYGPFAVDDIVLANNVGGGSVTWDFEASDHGFTSVACGPSGAAGTFFGVRSVSAYTIADPCHCTLAGNVAAFHDPAFQHPEGQHEIAISPIVDRGSLGPTYNAVLAEFDFYALMPQFNGVFYRPGWFYYPFVCPTGGGTAWSAREGQPNFMYVGADAACTRERNVATDWGVPGDAQLYRFVMEIYSSCDAFGIPPSQCTGVTNATPLLDNVSVGVTTKPLAPAISFELGCNFTDNFPVAEDIHITSVGNVDVVYDLHRGNPGPDKQGDSLQVNGPIPTASTKWEARFWWRVRREGPGQESIFGYQQWRTQVADGRQIVGPGGEFTFGWMDSMQVGAQVAKNKFISEFREDDDDFQFENTDANEMLPDLLFTPGTQIEYFITSNRVATPSVNFFLPDTSGGNFLEIEILPSYRIVDGQAVHPAYFILDFERGAEPFVERALNVVLNGAAPEDPIPNPAPWDRYDYLDNGGCHNVAFGRHDGGVGGASFQQLLGYRAIIVSAGTADGGAGEPSDFSVLSDWLTAEMCCGNQNRQGLIMNGDNAGAVLYNYNHEMLYNALGALDLCSDYNAVGCGPSPADDSRCLRIEDVPGGPFPSDHTAVGGSDYEIDAWGNGCPEVFGFDVFGTSAGGVGNRRYYDHDGTQQSTSFEQITKSVTTPGSANYRSVLDGASWHHLSARDLNEECRSDLTHIVDAAANEARAALNWIFDGALPGLLPDDCAGCPTVDAPLSGLGAMSQILDIRPNPAAHASAIRFALGAAMRVEITIYDVGGRRVRTLVDAMQPAGEWTAVWDGADTSGHRVGPGIYWAEMRAAGARSSRQIVVVE